MFGLDKNWSRSLEKYIFKRLGSSRNSSSSIYNPTVFHFSFIQFMWSWFAINAVCSIDIFNVGYWIESISCFYVREIRSFFSLPFKIFTSNIIMIKSDIVRRHNGSSIQKISILMSIINITNHLYVICGVICAFFGCRYTLDECVINIMCYNMWEQAIFGLLCVFFTNQ